MMYRATVASALIVTTSTSPKISDRTVTPLSVRAAGSAVGYVCCADMKGGAGGWSCLPICNSEYAFPGSGLDAVEIFYCHVQAIPPGFNAADVQFDVVGDPEFAARLFVLYGDEFPVSSPYSGLRGEFAALFRCYGKGDFVARLPKGVSRQVVNFKIDEDGRAREKGAGRRCCDAPFVARSQGVGLVLGYGSRFFNMLCDL